MFEIGPDYCLSGQIEVDRFVGNGVAFRYRLQSRYELAADSPPTIAIVLDAEHVSQTLDPQSGEFSSPPGRATGKYNMTVSAKGPDGPTARTTFAVNAMRLAPPLEKKIAVELGSGATLEMVLMGEFLMASPAPDTAAKKPPSAT